MNDNKRLCIKPNNAAINEPCAICGETTDPQIPYDIFPINSYQSVCYE